MVLLTSLAALAAFAQNAPEPRFEVATVKPSSPAAHGKTFSFNRGAGLEVRNGSLKDVIEMAYDVRLFQIAGGPRWLDSDRYDLTAKNAVDDPAGGIPRSRLRLQALLADRFQLQAHRETRELPVYALTVAKNGARLQEAGAVTPRDGFQTDCGRMTATGTTMVNLCLALSRELGRPVQDRTGLAGRYDFKLAWTPDAGPCSPGTAANLPDQPSLFSALPQQVGLRLDAAKGPVEMIVIDRAEKPDAN